MIQSANPGTTVSPEVLASNLVVMGMVPPVVPAADAARAIDYHGEAYALALFDALRVRGREVDWPLPL